MTTLGQTLDRPLVRPRGRHRTREATGLRLADAVTLIVTLVIVWLVWPASLGGRLGLVLVAGNSMEPTYSLGDLAITWRMEPEVGDAVLYLVPDGQAAGQPVIHRIVGGDPSGWITQGDNNANPDEWLPATDHVLGEVVMSVPAGGRALWFLRSPIAVAALAGTAVGLWMWPDREHRRGRHLPD